MKVNRIPRITWTVNDLGEREIHSAATTRAMNTGSDQAIEYIFNSDGLKAMMANVEIAIGVRMFAFFKINIAKNVDVPALSVFITINDVDGISPSQSPMHIRKEIPGGRTVIGRPTTSSVPIPLAMLLPTAM
jgi:hypothetical protein